VDFKCTTDILTGFIQTRNGNMASQYQHRQFFRRVPNELLARYFESRDTDLGVDFGKLKETEVEPVFQAFTTLPEEQQAAMEVDFQDINALANDGGIDALRNEAAFYEDETFPEEISTIDGLHAKAMWAFLHKPEYWKGASALLHADTVAGRSWKKRNDLPHVPPNVDEEDIQQLEKAISHYFNKTEGRGRNCKGGTLPQGRDGKGVFLRLPGRLRPVWRRVGTQQSHHSFPASGL
jgi:hypothetical protein